MDTPEIIIINLQRTSRSCVRKKNSAFRPLGGRGIAGRHAYVRDFVVMRILFNIEFVLPVRLESRRIRTSHISYHIYMSYNFGV